MPGLRLRSLFPSQGHQLMMGFPHVRAAVGVRLHPTIDARLRVGLGHRLTSLGGPTRLYSANIAPGGFVGTLIHTPPMFPIMPMRTAPKQ